MSSLREILDPQAFRFLYHRHWDEILNENIKEIKKIAHTKKQTLALGNVFEEFEVYHKPFEMC